MPHLEPTAQQRGSRRIGVAVEVPEPYASTLEQARCAAGDPTAEEMPPHITLVPPVHVPASATDLPELLRAAATTIEPFEVHLRGTGTFRPVSEVVFVAVAAGISSLEQLATALRAHPLDPPRRFPYHPHVTVAMDVPGDRLDAAYDSLADFEARFLVHSFRLYEHDGRERPPGARRRWHPLADFPLGNGRTPGSVTR